MGPQVQPKCFRHVALIYFQKMLQVLTSHTSKLPKKVLKNTKNMTPNSCSVRPEKFHPYDQSQSPVACHEDNRQGGEKPEMLFVSANMSHLQKDRKKVLDNHQNLNEEIYVP